MLFYLLAIAAWAHALFWGTGLAWWVTPRPWRRLWPIFALTCGLTLQSMVVWIAAYLNLPGTNSYGPFTEIIPALLFAVALRRANLENLIRDLKRTAGTLALSLVCLVALISPYAASYHGLTTGSLGSCDAADYAGGARAFMEFARSDRMGFLGLTEVTRVMSVDTFFDFYLRLMHFTPCAIIALNGTIFGCAPHEIIAVLAAVFLAGSVPVVFVISRDLLHLGRWVSLGIALLFAFSPINWYAVEQTALAQLLAAQGIAVLTWAAWNLWRFGNGPRTGWPFLGILTVAFALILGSYTFIVVVCLAPAVAFAGGLALATRQVHRFWRWLLWIAAPLTAAAFLFAPRVDSIVERFAVFKKHDEGWPIPFLWPEGWLGLVRGPLLHPLGAIFHVAGGLLLGSGLLLTALNFRTQRRQIIYGAICLAVPALIGSSYLNFMGIHWGHDANRSYLAYKLFSVFYPGILPALCIWFTLAGRSLAERTFCWLTIGALAIAVGRVDFATFRAMRSPTLIVDRELLEIRALEQSPTLTSINVIIPDMWSRLWANCFLLRKEQYFATHSYEARLDTPLRGRWDLNGGIIAVQLPAPGTRVVDSTYSLADTASPSFVRVFLGEGWHEPEHVLHSRAHWVWSKGSASVDVTNPHPYPVHATIKIKLRSAHSRHVEVWIRGVECSKADVDPSECKIELPQVDLAPGVTTVELRLPAPPDPPTASETRALGFALYRFEVDVAETR
ncbi:MAG TPA: hypothetical protein VHD32_03105 [Candidatus Didemnitutus sp.]|nr:hypothetical protein [Candidatus Didemnitutus sp.]